MHYQELREVINVHLMFICGGGGGGEGSGICRFKKWKFDSLMQNPLSSNHVSTSSSIIIRSSSSPIASLIANCTS